MKGSSSGVDYIYDHTSKNSDDDYTSGDSDDVEESPTARQARFKGRFTARPRLPVHTGDAIVGGEDHLSAAYVLASLSAAERVDAERGEAAALRAEAKRLALALSVANAEVRAYMCCQYFWARLTRPPFPGPLVAYLQLKDQRIKAARAKDLS